MYTHSVTYAIDALINQPTALLTAWPLAPSPRHRMGLQRHHHPLPRRWNLRLVRKCWTASVMIGIT
jgi:hypothetical protein